MKIWGWVAFLWLGGAAFAADKIPFDFYSVKDELGRTVDFYVSNQSTKKLPLIVWIQGSGCTSHFRKTSDGKISGGYQNLLLDLFKDKAHIMAVEKPGVKYLDENSSPGTADKCSDEFNREHTLEGWTEALRASLEKALKLEFVDSSKVIVIGHSEGAIMAASLAAASEKVTHTALLSGSGASQLFDFIVNRKADEVTKTLESFDKIKKDPENYSKFYLGHPYNRWASFFSYSTSDLLKNTKAEIFLMNGTADKNAPVQSFDVMVVELKRAGRKFELTRLDGATHSLDLPGDKQPAGMTRAFQKVGAWALLR